MDGTEGLVRGQRVLNTGSPITRPSTFYPFTMKLQRLWSKLQNNKSLLRVVDLLAPYHRGGKIGLFGGAGVEKTVLIMELFNNVAKAHGYDLGEEHYITACGVQKVLQNYKNLQDIIAILGMDEPSEEDKLTVARARKIR